MATHVYTRLFLNPPPYKAVAWSKISTDDELSEPEIDANRTGEFLRSFQEMNSSIDVSKIWTSPDEAAQAAAPKEKGAARRERIAQMQKQHNLSKEVEDAREEIARLMKFEGAHLTNAAVKSCTGQLALNLLLIQHHHARLNGMPEAMDIWLDLDPKYRDRHALQAAVEAGTTHVVERQGQGGSPARFVFPDLLADVYKKCRTALKALAAFVNAPPNDDLQHYQLQEMGDRLVPLNFSMFHRHR